MTSTTRVAIGVAFVASIITSTSAAVIKSGLQPGKMVFAFEPTHIAGPDKGTKTCPVCKYGETPAVQIWVNGDSPANVSKLADALEKAIKKAGPDNLKAFIVAIKPGGAKTEQFAKSARAFSSEKSAPHVAVTVLGSKEGAVADYKINASPQVKNTVLVYSKLKVVANFVNLNSDAKGIRALLAATGKATRAK